MENETTMIYEHRLSKQMNFDSLLGETIRKKKKEKNEKDPETATLDSYL